MVAICRDGLFSRVYYRKRRRQESGDDGVVEKGGEGILGIKDEESTLTLTVMLKKLRWEKKMEKRVLEGVEHKDLIYGDRIEGQKGKVEEGEENNQENGVSDVGFGKEGVSDGIVEGKKSERFEENGDVGFGEEGVRDENEEGLKTEHVNGVVEKNGRWNRADMSTMCHQCQRYDNGKVVRCRGCSKGESGSGVIFLA